MQCAPDEEPVIEAAFGLGPFGGSATLTNRRIVLTAKDVEESVPLGAVTSVRTGFSRDYSAAFWGGLLLAIAIAFGIGYRPLETGVNTLALSIEKRMSDKTPEGDAYGRYLYIPGGVVWLAMLPLIGWGAYRLVTRLIGETELVICTASGELRRVGAGRQEDMQEFGAEVGRRAGR